MGRNEALWGGVHIWPGAWAGPDTISAAQLNLCLGDRQMAQVLVIAPDGTLVRTLGSGPGHEGEPAGEAEPLEVVCYRMP